MAEWACTRQVTLASPNSPGLDGAKVSGVLVPQVAWRYLPANAEGNDLVVWKDGRRRVEWRRFAFPRQSRSPWLCIPDFFRPASSGEEDWAAFHVVTMGPAISEATAALFAQDRYQDYLLHGLGVEMAEALAEHWHRRTPPGQVLRSQLSAPGRRPSGGPPRQVERSATPALDRPRLGWPAGAS